MPNDDMNRLMDQVRIHVPGVVDTVAKMEMFSVLKEFFNDSNVWRDEIGFVTVHTDSTPYEDPAAFTYLIEPQDGACNRLLRVNDESGRPVPATMVTPGEVVLKRAPVADKVYYAIMAITVADPVDADEFPVFPDWVLPKYHNAILDGILGRLMNQTAKPYSSPNMAGQHTKKFRSAIARARKEASHGNTFATQRWRYPRGFA